MLRQFDNCLIDEAKAGRVQIIRLNFGEVSQVGVEDVALQAKAGKFAFAGDRDKARGFEFLHVVGQGGSGDRLALTYLGAGNGTIPGADLLQNFMASRISQGLGDEVNLVLGKGFLRH